MDKKTSFIVFMLIFSVFLVTPPPMAKADGSIDAQDIWLSATDDHYPPLYDGTNDGSETLEDALVLSWINVTNIWGNRSWGISIYQTRANVEKDTGDDGPAKMAVYAFITDDNAGAMYGLSDETQLTSLGVQWYTFSWSTPIDIPDGEYEFYIGIMGDNFGGLNKVVYNTGGTKGQVVKGSLTYPTFPDPLTGESSVDRNTHVRAFILATNTNSTLYNQYWGTATEYTARRDIDVTFPTGTGNREINFTYPKTENFLNVTYSNGGFWNASLTSGEYTKHDYNATHWLIQIQEAEIAPYGDDFRLFTETYGYNYNLLGLYSENGTRAGSVTVTSHAPSNSTEYNIDGEQGIYTDEKPIQFTWSLSGGGSRKIYTAENSENIYIFTPDDVYTSYSFNIRDYTGSIGSGDTFLEALRVINGTERIIERVLIWDTVNSVPLTLTIGKIYVLQVRLPDDSTHRFGYYTPGSDPTPTLTLRGIDFDDQAHYVGEHISIDIARPNFTHIQINYQDDLAQTTSVFVEICNLNTTQVWNDTSTADAVQFNWYGADSETDYLVNLVAQHEFYDMVTSSAWLEGEKPELVDMPDLSVLGTGFRYGLSILILLAVFTSGSTETRGIVTGGTVAIAYVLRYINWLPAPYAALHLSAFIVVAWILGGTR